MTDELKTQTITFRATPEMVRRLAELGCATDNSRSNVCFLLLTDALIRGRGKELLPGRAARFRAEG